MDRALMNLLDWADSLSQQKYDSPLEHFQANQYALLIRKNVGLKIKGLDPRGTAIRKFFQAEEACKVTNSKFRQGTISRETMEILSRARRWIEYVISSEPLFENIIKQCDFGPGASVGVHGNATSKARKILAEEWTCTPSAFDYAKHALHEHAQLAEYIYSLSMWRPGMYCVDETSFAKNFAYKVKSVQNNKIVFVPKTVKTHRSIAVEPLLNSFLQKGIDNVLRLRLKRVGLDLSDQEPNAMLARQGSLGIFGKDYSTIDLSSASDSISSELVRNLLPMGWHILLNCTRSPSYELDGETYRFEKFCSMGNGFCFPLQTLIFSSLIHAVDPSAIFGKDCRVYGDDIICLPHVAARVIEVLNDIGFQTNDDKTFLEGPFRESCGADWYLGVDVRPYTLDFAFDSLETIIKFLNGTKRSEFTSEFFAPLSYDTFKVPAELQFVRPYPGSDDSAVEVPLDEFMTSPFARFSQGYWGWRELRHRPVRDRVAETHDRYRSALLYGVLSGIDSQTGFTLRRETKTKVVHRTSAGAQSLWTPAPPFVHAHSADLEFKSNLL